MSHIFFRKFNSCQNTYAISQLKVSLNCYQKIQLQKVTECLCQQNYSSLSFVVLFSLLKGLQLDGAQENCMTPCMSAGLD